MRRRRFIGLLSGAAAYPLRAHAQAGPPRLIGVLMPTAIDQPVSRPRLAALLDGLKQAGWSDGQNLRMEVRWTSGNADLMRKYAAELVALAPDVIVTAGSATLTPLLQATRTVPIVFVHVPDPVGAGYVDSMARPGGNATGFLLFEFGIGVKWLELLKQAAPALKRVAVVRDAAISAGMGQWGAIQTAAPSLGVEASPINVRVAGEIERAVAAFARGPSGALIVTGSALAVLHGALIIRLAGQHKLPAVYFDRQFVAAGGLMSYGPDLVDQYRRAAGYADRILKGEKPADLPVQGPTKYDLVVNLKAAKALGLTVPDAILVAANEIIE